MSNHDLTPTQGEHAQTEALRPKFGDLLRNTMASESNPRRDAYFIREVHRSGGGVNPGRWFEMTDGKGETWLSNPQNMVPAAPAQPAAPQGVAYAELADVDALAQEIRRVDGSHNLGAGALAEALMPFLRASHGQAPAGAAQWAYSEIETRIKELMAGTAHPESMSVAQAMKQLVNELWQRYGQAPTAQADSGVQEDAALSVTSILIDIVPGLDGMGHEVYAKSVKDVEDKLSAMGQELEDWQLGIRKYAPAAGAVAGPMDDLAELSLLNRLIELGNKAAGAHATSNSDDGHKGTAAYVQWQELRAEMGELIRAAYTAAPTPAAQQREAGWQDISTAPKDGTRFVAAGYNYGIYSETRHTCIAQWFQGCWMEASDWNATGELKYLTHWMPLPPLECAARKQGGA